MTAPVAMSSVFDAVAKKAVRGHRLMWLRREPHCTEDQFLALLKEGQRRMYWCWELRHGSDMALLTIGDGLLMRASRFRAGKEQQS